MRIIGLSESDKFLWDSSGLNFCVRPTEDAYLLGAPLSHKETDAALRQSLEQLQKVKQRLFKLSAHEAFFLLKSSLAAPRLQYLFRTAPCFQSSEVTRLDEEIRTILSSVLNLKLDESSWSQASLPVRWAGLELGNRLH